MIQPPALPSCQASSAEHQHEQRVGFHIEPGTERAREAGAARERPVHRVEHCGEGRDGDDRPGHGRGILAEQAGEERGQREPCERYLVPRAEPSQWHMCGERGEHERDPDAEDGERLRCESVTQSAPVPEDNGKTGEQQAQRDGGRQSAARKRTTRVGGPRDWVHASCISPFADRINC